MIECNYIEVSLSDKEGKSVVTERFIRALKNIICKHMTLISKDVYIDKLDETAHDYSNICHRTTKMKQIFLIYLLKKLQYYYPAVKISLI